MPVLTCHIGLVDVDFFRSFFSLAELEALCSLFRDGLCESDCLLPLHTQTTESEVFCPYRVFVQILPELLMAETCLLIHSLRISIALLSPECLLSLVDLLFLFFVGIPSEHLGGMHGI